MTSGLDFVSLQVRDLAASAAFYERYLGFTRQPGPPHAVVFDSKPASFAVREPVAGFDLEGAGQLGAGVALWFYSPDTQAIHDRLVADDIRITAEPTDGPFGRTFAFADPDGYSITLHDRAE